MGKFSLIVPTLNPGEMWQDWVCALRQQTIQPTRVIVVDSGSTDQSLEISVKEEYEIHEIQKSEFNHGGTRQLALNMISDEEVAVYMTQDAILADTTSLERLLRSLCDNRVAAVCGRQLPRSTAGPIEAHSRIFNYSDTSRVSSLGDCTGLKSIFLSNSFAAYRIEALKNVGGFPEDVIFGEDMYVAAKLLKAGYSLAYAADACVYHSHKYTLVQDMKRYFDMGVFHARRPWIRKEFGNAENEGVKYVLSEMRYLLTHAFWRIPEALIRTIFRYSGYKLGGMENHIPLKIKRKISMNSGYFNGA